MLKTRWHPIDRDVFVWCSNCVNGITVQVGTVSLRAIGFMSILTSPGVLWSTPIFPLLITGLEVIKLEFILRLKIKCNDWLIVDVCPQSANHCALF